MSLPIPPALQWPDTVHPALSRLREEYDRILDERREVTAALLASQEAEKTAPQRDRIVMAEATRARKALPKQTEVAKAVEQTARLRSQRAGIEEALWNVHAEIEQTIERVRDEWDATLAAEAEADRQQYAAAVDTAIAARGRLGTTAAARDWLQRFPHKPVLTVPTAAVATLQSPSHSGYAFDRVAQALREDAETVYVPAEATPPRQLTADDLRREARDPGVELTIGA